MGLKKTAVKVTPTEADAFMADILTNPNDDAPRLIYADWLSEQNDPVAVALGEFIRLQFEACSSDSALATWPAWPPPGVLTRAQQLLDENIDRWLALPEKLKVSEPFEWVFHRGFLGQVRCPLWAWMQHGHELRARHPIVAVNLADRKPRVLLDAAQGHLFAWREAGQDTPAHAVNTLAVSPQYECIVPAVLWDQLAGQRYDHLPHWACYGSPRKARSDLSHVLLMHAKAVAAVWT